MPDVHGNALRPPGLRILIIEDEAVCAKLLQERLASSALSIAEIVWTPTLGDGLERSRSGAFDVVLLDLGLTDSPDPRSTVTEAIPLLQLSSAVLVVTGSDSLDLWALSLAMGAEDFLTKKAFLADPGCTPYLAHAILSASFRHERRPL